MMMRTFVLAMAVFIVLGSSWAVYITARINVVSERLQERPMLEAKWTDATGVQRTVQTFYRESGHEEENDAEFEDRHDARVKRQMVRYPK